MSERRKALKVALILVAILAFPPLLRSGYILYWNIRIRAAIRACRSDMVPAAKASDPPVLPEKPLAVLKSAGCRAVPRVLAAVETSSNEQFAHAGSKILFDLCNRTSPTEMFPAKIMDLASAAFDLWYRDRPEQHQKGLAEGREWWRNHEARHHPWWKFWSSRCLAD